MPVFRIRYSNGTEESVEADYYKDEKSFIDFYAELGGIEHDRRVLRVKAAAVNRIVTLDEAE